MNKYPKKNPAYYSDLAEAIRAIVPIDKTYQIVWHNLSPGEIIKPHYHKLAKEWIIISHGIFEVNIDGVVNIFNLVFEKEYIVIPLPRNSVHNIVAKTAISYFVVRDKKDRVNYVHQKKPAKNKK